MTMRSFGRVLPIHISMLRLAGYSPDYRRRDIRIAESDDDFLKAMQAGLSGLKRATKQDFGYDLAAWRDFLIAAPDDEYGYKHPYAFRGVDRAVQKAIESERRKGLIAQLESPEDEHQRLST